MRPREEIPRRDSSRCAGVQECAGTARGQWEAGGTFVNRDMIWSGLWFQDSNPQKVCEVYGRVDRLEAQEGTCGAEA